MRKSKDSAGHEHGSDGKFTSSAGNSYEYRHEDDGDGGGTVHEHSGVQVGRVVHTLDGKFRANHGKRDPKTTFPYVTTHGKFEKPHAAAKAVADEHDRYSKRTRKRMTTIGDVFGAASTASDVLSKADVAAGTAPYLIDGSFEHQSNMVRDPLIAGSGCPQAYNRPRVPGDPLEFSPSHYPSVIATFPDRGIVQCTECGTNWEVPYTIETADGVKTVVTGTPEERVQAFISPEHLAATDHDGDEPEETA
jgi:hypothetical protein